MPSSLYTFEIDQRDVLNNYPQLTSPVWTAQGKLGCMTPRRSVHFADTDMEAEIGEVRGEEAGPGIELSSFCRCQEAASSPLGFLGRRLPLETPPNRLLHIRHQAGSTRTCRSSGLGAVHRTLTRLGWGSGEAAGRGRAP